MAGHNQHTKQRTGDLLSTSTGSEIAEAALVLPLAFMMLLGIYWFGRAFNIYATINDAAREGARSLVARTCATCNNNPFPPGNGVAIITQTMKASSVDPTQIQTYVPTLNFCAGGNVAGNCTANNNVTMCNNVLLSPPAAAGPQACGASVSFQYPYQFWLPFTSLNNQQILLTVNVQMKGEY
ncbi:MAG: TadE/TadG family type IV pilus assembly protein [Terriglobales bacterium]